MENIKRPSLWLYFTEVIRAIIEHWRGYIFLKKYKPVRQGDGHPVLVIPGLLCTDFSTTILRCFINQAGYTAYGWELGRNLGDVKDLRDLKRLDTRIKQIQLKHPQQRITLIGWSMGGIYARELAKRNPEQFRQVITIVSPFADVAAPNNVTWIFNLLNDPKDFDYAWREQLPIPAPIATTAFYSKQDGIVPWEACREWVEDALHQNIEVRGSHSGVGATPSVLQIIGEKLAESVAFEKAFAKQGMVYTEG